MKAVELKNITFSYDGKTNVLKNADFFADYNELTLVCGHSGQGKSTLMSIISGIIPNVVFGSLEGGVFVAGEDMRGKKLGYVCRKVGVVLQNADEQIIQKYVEDEIAFGCENLAFAPDKIKQQIEIVCELMKLDPAWKTRTLSGGQKQRLITASTLAMGQKIIILDEPLANLDKSGARLLMSTLKSLASAGYCVIVVEHRLDVVLPYADRLWHIAGQGVKEIADKNRYLEEQSRTISDATPAVLSTKDAFVLENAAFEIKRKQILKNVTFGIPKGGKTVLLGENGCGKTTLLRLIARLNRPSGGSVRQTIGESFGQNGRRSKAWFKKVGVVYQNPDYQLFMPTVRGEIAFGAVSEKYAERMLELFGLSALAQRHPHSLSEGQKRRLSIAAVAACAPEVLILDEPTVGQDYEGLKELVKILNTLHAETGNTMITVTHDMRCAEALCDKAVVIADGVVAEQGGKELARAYFTRD